MHTYIHTCIHTYIHTYMHTYIHTCMHTYIHTYIHAYIRTYIYRTGNRWIHIVIYESLLSLWPTDLQYFWVTANHFWPIAKHFANGYAKRPFFLVFIPILGSFMQ